jgi:hypothetical protein
MGRKAMNKIRICSAKPLAIAGERKREGKEDSEAQRVGIHRRRIPLCETLSVLIRRRHVGARAKTQLQAHMVDECVWHSFLVLGVDKSSRH